MLDQRIFNQQVLNKIVRHAEKYPNIEVCGVVVQYPDGTQKAYYGKNVAENKASEFELDDNTFAKFESFENFSKLENEKRLPEIIAIYHSHPLEDSSAYLSRDDIYQSKLCGLPYLVYHPSLKAWDYFDPSLTENPRPFELKGNPKTIEYYLNWKWEWDRSDCCSLFRAYYKGMLGIELEDHTRAYEPKDIFTDGWSDFSSVLPERSFSQVSRPKHNDVVLMSIEGTTLHHVGVIVDDKLLHLYNEKHPSELVPYKDSLWERMTREIWRYAND